MTWTLVAVGVAVAALSGRADSLAETYANEALTRALVTFAVTRALNGVISAAQGTEVSLEPGGVGVNFSVGEMLDPINDLVERFSAVMLVATSSLGLQSLLLRITASWGVTAVLIGLAAIVVGCIWIPAARSVEVSAATRWLLIAALVRFAVPALVLTSTAIFDGFLADQHAEATQVLERTSRELERFNEESAAADDEERSLLDRLGNFVGQLDARQRLEALRTQAAEAAERIVDLIVIFVFQTIVLPLVFLWLLVELAKSLIARTAAI